MKLENLHKLELKNGMKFHCMPNHTNPTISLALKSTVGSFGDPVEKTGVSGIAASLITKGTDTLSAADIAVAIDSLGMDIGFSAGKHTSGLSARVLAEALPNALKLITAILSSPKPPQDELDRMKQRMLTGLMMKKEDPAALATDQLLTMIYGKDHPYGHGLDTIIETVPNIDLASVSEFYTRLQPAGFFGVIVGDFQIEQLEKDLNKTLGSWKGGGVFDLQSPDLVDLPAKPITNRLVTPGKPQSDIALGFQGIKRSNPDYYALAAGNTAMGRLSLGGRIGQRVRDEEGMAYYAYSAFDAGVGAGPYSFRAGVNPANEERATELALEEMNKVKANGLTADEVASATTYMAGSMVRQIETNGGMASMLMSQIIHNLGDDYYLRYPDMMKSLTLESVNAAMAKHLHTDRYCLSVAGPEK